MLTNRLFSEVLRGESAAAVTGQTLIESPEAILHPGVGALTGEWGVLGGRRVSSITLASLVDALSPEKLVGGHRVYDVVVVGGGPAGLAAAEGASAAGLTVLVVEGATLGGQASPSAGPESFPELAVRPPPSIGTAPTSVERCPAQVVCGLRIVSLSPAGNAFVLGGHDGRIFRARAVVIAIGASYARLRVSNGQLYERKGLHYIATGMEAALCADEEVLIVGARTLACQAAVFLGGVARHVHLLLHGGDLDVSVSSYLAERIRQSSHVTMHPFTEVTELTGDPALERVAVRNTVSGAVEIHSVRNLFVFLGLTPNTAWIEDQLDLDDEGFVLTNDRFSTSCAGVFAVGDVRSKSPKSVAAAIADGFDAAADLVASLDNSGPNGA